MRRFPKRHWPEGEFHVRYWAQTRGYKHLEVIASSDTWDLPQRQEWDFEAGTRQWTCLNGADMDKPNDAGCKVLARVGAGIANPDDPDNKGAAPKQVAPGIEPSGTAGGTKGGDASSGGAKGTKSAADLQEDRGAIPFSVHSAYAVADKGAAWDAGKEVGSMAPKAGVLKPRHGWGDSAGDKERKGSYKVPHHRAGSGLAVVFKACAAGSSCRGGAPHHTDRRIGVADN